MLALLMRQRELAGSTVADGDLDFVLPETRALYGALGGEVPVELEPFVERAERWLPLVRSLPADRLAGEIAETQTHIKSKLLEQQRKDISGLGEDTEISKLAPQLNHLAQGMGALEHDPRERERAGTR